MYLRPRQLFEKFLVSEAITRVDVGGHVQKEFITRGEIFGCITNFRPREGERFFGLKHDITHKIVARWGQTAANVGDKLVNVGGTYLVEAVEELANHFKIYFVTRRGDLK